MILRYFATTLVPIVWGLAAATSAQANTPWGLIAKRVVGKVEQVVQQPEGGQPGVQVATVVLDAPAQQIFETTLATIKQNPNVQITAQNSLEKSVQISDGTRKATLSIKEMGQELSQLMVVATNSDPQDQTTSRVVQAVMRICKEMQKNCSTD